MLLTNPPDIRWVTGFSGSNGMVLITRRSVRLYTDVRYDEQARAEAAATSIHIAVATSLQQCAAELGHFRTLAVLGVQEQHLTLTMMRNLRALARGTKLRPLTSVTDAMRMVKTDDEIAHIRAAAAITDRVYAELPALIREGMEERALAAEITYRHRLHGAEADSFDPIVLFGARSSLVHGTPGGTRLREGDAILVDMGCKVQGYCSDMTRMLAFGRASRMLKRVHSAVRAAQDAALALVQPGASGRDVDAEARRVLEAHGLAQHFSHSLGHGVGLDIHEFPRLSPVSRDVLAAGHTVTVEPGVYIPGKLGVRVEDLLVLHDAGAEILSTSPRELTII